MVKCVLHSYIARIGELNLIKYLLEQILSTVLDKKLID